MEFGVSHGDFLGVFGGFLKVYCVRAQDSLILKFWYKNGILQINMFSMWESRKGVSGLPTNKGWFSRINCQFLDSMQERWYGKNRCYILKLYGRTCLIMYIKKEVDVTVFFLFINFVTNFFYETLYIMYLVESTLNI